MLTGRVRTAAQKCTEFETTVQTLAEALSKCRRGVMDLEMGITTTTTLEEKEGKEGGSMALRYTKVCVKLSAAEVPDVHKERAGRVVLAFNNATTIFAEVCGCKKTKKQKKRSF